MNIKSLTIILPFCTQLSFWAYSMHNKEAHIKLAELYSEYACTISMCLKRPVSVDFLHKFDVPFEKLTCTQAEKTLILELKKQIELLSKEIEKVKKS